MPPLRARAPLDLDLEDHLIFGLSPVRFGYLAIGALAAYALGGHLPYPFGLALAAVLLSLAAAFAWVRWQGRPLDAWLLDLAVHTRRNLEIELDPVVLRRIRTPLRQSRHRTIAVSGAAQGAGATTVAVELGTALALKGRRVSLRPTPAVATAAKARLASEDAECVILDLSARVRARRADLALVVVSGSPTPAPPAPRIRSAHVAVVANRFEGEPPPGTYAIPADPAVSLAQSSSDAVIVQFPASRAAAAFHRLADAVDPSRPGPWQQESSEVPPAG